MIIQNQMKFILKRQSKRLPCLKLTDSYNITVLKILMMNKYTLSLVFSFQMIPQFFDIIIKTQLHICFAICYNKY